MALKKGGLKADEAVVIENAPLGVEAAQLSQSVCIEGNSRSAPASSNTCPSNGPVLTAIVVKYGKPNPEPYLMALKKGGLKADEAVVIENAPLGVESSS